MRILRIISDWNLCNISKGTVLEFEAEPHSFMPYVQTAFKITLWPKLLHQQLDHVFFKGMNTNFIGEMHRKTNCCDRSVAHASSVPVRKDTER